MFFNALGAATPVGPGLTTGLLVLLLLFSPAQTLLLFSRCYPPSLLVCGGTCR